MRLRCKLAVEFRDLAIGDSSNQSTGSETWRLYCRDGRVAISESNYDWPSVLAEVIEALSRTDWNVSEVALILRTSTSQLVKLLKKYAPAFQMFNAERKSRGQKPFA